VKSKDIQKTREGFHILSDILIEIAGKFGTSGKQTILKYHCPMAFGNRGADWLQNKHGTENPYFGSIMFKCGVEVETISNTGLKGKGGGQHHDR